MDFISQQFMEEVDDKTGRSVLFS